jgi:DNA-directed RNA polymerase specialized sigma24 family protein
MSDPSPPAARSRAPSAGRRWELTQAALERLLGALGDDRAEAGRQYVEIRRRLVRLFAWRGCREPEELADEAIDRVARKLAGGLEIRAEDPFRFFCGVAFLVFKEVLRQERRERRALEEVRRRPPPEPAGDDPRLECLRRCLAGLAAEERRLLVDYHRGEKGERIRRRRRLAARLAIPINALRIRVHRLRARLESCVTTCLAKNHEP